MSSQKDKFLASAQKFIQKGQFDRALRDYEQLVTVDPKDVKHRQKLAELLIRCNRREDAIREYDTIARFYEENGFNLKSIAVYKQIQRLDPSNIEISLSLAALNEKQGMIGNALSEYKTVFENYEKSGRTAEALKILERMQGVDPDNVDIRLKLAETLFAVGTVDKAYQEYTRAALMLKERGMASLFEKVGARIRELFPDKTDTTFDILVEQVRSGAVEDAIPRLRRFLEGDPDNLRVLVLLAEAYKMSGDVKSRREALQRVLDNSPEDLSAINGLIECSVSEKDLEGSLVLIDRYSPALLSAGAYGELEHYFTILQGVAPYDIRLLHGLKSLYELTGESSKLADVQVSLNILSQKESGGSEQSSDAHGEIDLSSLSSVSDTSSAPDFAWGDDIDLTNAADIGSGPQEDIRDADTEEFAFIDLTPDHSNAVETPADEFEIDISFELPEDTDLFAAAPSGSGMEISSMEPEQTEPPLLEQAGIEVPGATAGLLEAFTIDTEISPDLPLSDGDASAVEQGEEESSLPLDLEPHAAISPSEEPIPVVTIEPPDISSALPEEGMASSSEPASGAPAAQDSSELEGILYGFKETLDEQLDKEDAETHYNLGIAYMEMALHDDAIKQFRIAANDPSRELDCLTLLGVCCREKGDFAGSEQVLTSVLSLGDLRADRVMNLQYELGLLYMAAGREDEALQSFRDVFAANPGFRDTMKMIEQLSRKAGSFDLSDMGDVEIELEELD